MKHFYSHLIEIQTLIIELDSLDLNEKQRLHLAELVDSSLHHTILDAVLSQLEDEDKRLFLQHLSKDEHDKIWELLNNKVENIEEKIKASAEDLKNELHEDIKSVKRKN